MYKNFCVQSCEVNSNNEIEVVFSNHVDISTFVMPNVEIVRACDGDVLLFDATKKSTKVTLKLKHEPAPNQEYYIKIKEVKNATGDKLEECFCKKIFFMSEVKDKVTILYPVNFQVISNLNIKWIQSAGKYYYDIQIAKDSGFHDISLNTQVFNTDEVTLSGLVYGQYYLRIRLKKDNESGEWSETVSFLFSEKKPSELPPDHIDYVDETCECSINNKIIASPINGEAIKEFLFQFEKELDENSEAKIVIVRKDV